MICGPGPGILNSILSNPLSALAQSIASRNEPAPLSFVLVTLTVDPLGQLETKKQAENPELLLDASVAVATT